MVPLVDTHGLAHLWISGCVAKKFDSLHLENEPRLNSNAESQKGAANKMAVKSCVLDGLGSTVSSKVLWSALVSKHAQRLDKALAAL